MAREPELAAPDRQAALALIGRIYDAALDPSAWPRIVPEVIKFIGGSTGVISTPFASASQGGLTITYRIPETFVSQRAARYAQHDLWTQAAVERNLFTEGNVLLDQDLVPEETLLKSVFYREFLQPQGIARLCVGIIFGRETAGGTPTICSAMRDIGEPRFTESERERMQVMVPHLSRALGVMFRLRDADLKRVATLAALDHLAGGVILLDGGGRVLHANRAAQRSLQEGDGLAIRSPRAGEKRLAASDSKVHSAIEAALKECLNPGVLKTPHFSRGVAVPRPSGSPDYVLQFAPLSAGIGLGTADGDPCAIVFLTDPAAPLPLDPLLLKKLYGLTPAEIRIATELAAGAQIETAAAALGVSSSTARSHLKRIFVKTGSNRQSDLIRLLVSLASTR